jgi:adenosine deaminase
VDIANDELKYESLPFASCFQRAREAGLRTTAHSGEVFNTFMIGWLVNGMHRWDGWMDG